MASASARPTLEKLMAIPGYEIDPVAKRFVGSLVRIADEGRAHGEAEMLLVIAGKRGIDIDEQTRNRVLACTDTAIIEGWADRVLTGLTAEDIFGT
jgi:hypothetical protein